MIETEKFYVDRVEREINKSRELGSGRMPVVSSASFLASARAAKDMAQNGLPAFEVA